MLPVNFEYSVEITKAYEDEGNWIVEGYAATSDFDMQEDIITQDAIKGSAKDLVENSTVLHNHNPDEAVGRVLDSKARKGGLFLKILISKTVPDIWQQVKEGVLNKFSVRGKILDAKASRSTHGSFLRCAWWRFRSWPCRPIPRRGRSTGTWRRRSMSSRRPAAKSIWQKEEWKWMKTLLWKRNC